MAEKNTIFDYAYKGDFQSVLSCVEAEPLVISKPDTVSSPLNCWKNEKPAIS